MRKVLKMMILRSDLETLEISIIQISWLACLKRTCNLIIKIWKILQCTKNKINKDMRKACIRKNVSKRKSTMNSKF